MPLKPAADDRKILLIAGAVLLVMLGAMALFAPVEDQEVLFPSTYSAQSGGAKAAYLLLKESGYNVERWTQPPQELPEGPGAVLILAEPFPGVGDKPEREALEKFLANGGRVVATGIWAAFKLPEGNARAGGRAAQDCPT